MTTMLRREVTLVVVMAFLGAQVSTASSQRRPDPPAGAVSAVTVSQDGGVQAGSRFRFSVQVTGFDAGSVNYRWEFGDGAASNEPPTRARGTRIRLRRPTCPHPGGTTDLVEMDFDLGLVLGGQTLSGTLLQAPGSGFEQSGAIALHRQ